MKQLDDIVFKRTQWNSSTCHNRGDLERRALILLKLIDGTTPVSVFEKHLKHFNVPHLLEQLYTAELIELAAKSSGVDIVKLFSEVLPDSSNTASTSTHNVKPENSIPESTAADSNAIPADAELIDQLDDDELTETGLDDITAQYLKRYAPGIGNDSDIAASFSGKQASAQEAKKKGVRNEYTYSASHA